MEPISLSSCPSPFLDIAQYPYTGGELENRFCSQIDQNLTCCLPCPITDWVYPDNFEVITTAANWVGLASFICCMVLLLSFAVLPARKTNRHYLTVCLLAAVACFTFAFVIPLGTHSDECHDAITPNNMRSDLTCALSGAFVLFGGLSATIWVLIRSLSLYLQICWQITPGKKFFYLSLLGGWGVPLLLAGLSLALSGVSYRFGPICHINHDYSLETLWGPLLGFTGLATIFQFLTFGYCVRVYLRSLWDSAATSVASSNAASTALPSTHGSYKTLSTKAAYRRIRKVIALQWRGIMVVIILIVTAVYFAVIFLTLDSQTVATQKNPELAMPWLTCLYLNGGDKNNCLSQASSLILNEAVVAAVLYLIAVMGFWCILFLGRRSMLGAWWELFQKPFNSDSDTWISADAARTTDPRTYEMLTAPSQHYHLARSNSRLVAKATAQEKDIASATGDMPESTHDHASVRHLIPDSKEIYLDEVQPIAHERISNPSYRPNRPDSQNTARVTFSQDFPTYSPTRSSFARSVAASESNIPQAYTVPNRVSTDSYNFSRPQPIPFSQHDVRRPESTLSRPRDRSSPALSNDWYGRDSSSRAPIAHQWQSTNSAQREWDARSTFAHSESSRHISPGNAR